MIALEATHDRGAAPVGVRAPGTSDEQRRGREVLLQADGFTVVSSNLI